MFRGKEKKTKRYKYDYIKFSSIILLLAFYQNHKGIHYAIITVYFISFFSSQTLQFNSTWKKERNKYMLVCGKAYFYYNDILLMKTHFVVVIMVVVVK